MNNTYVIYIHKSSIYTSLKWWTPYTSNSLTCKDSSSNPPINHHDYFKPLLPSPPPSFQKKLTLLSRHHHRYFENFLKKRKRKRKEKTIARFAASPPRLSSTPRMNLYDKYVELRVMYNCWQEKKERKKRGDDWKFRKRRASWERVSRK